MPCLIQDGIMAHQPLRIWLLTPRIDSRLLLKLLIGLNVFLALYFIFSMGPGAQKTPCVVVINSNNNALGATRHNQQNHPNNNNHPSEDAVDKTTTSPENFWYEKSQSKMFLEAEAGTEGVRRIPWWTTETRGSYSVINSFVMSDQASPADSITLTTQGSYEFLRHSVPLCKRWDGPISIAVYAPGDDFPIALQIIHFYRRCRDSCVRRDITWHLIYDSNYGPSLTNISFPDTYVTAPHVNCSLTDDELLSHLSSNFRSKHKVPYPINVARNVARLQSRTKYLLASDIELYPSINVINMFQELLRREESDLISNINRRVPHVYVLPIFEVNAGLDPPETKSQLVQMMKNGEAIFFHKWVCDSCQNFPDRDKWIGEVGSNQTLNIFRVTKRQRDRSAWEPLYIGTNAEPLYDERLSWDGKRDKMSQMYEMCLMNYDVLILDNAFLVHAPGIKHIDASDNKKRLTFIKRNNSVYNTIISMLRKKYGTRNKC